MQVKGRSGMLPGSLAVYQGSEPANCIPINSFFSPLFLSLSVSTSDISKSSLFVGTFIQLIY